MKRLVAVLFLALLVLLVVGVGAASGQGKGEGGNDSASGWARQGTNEDTFSAKSSELGTNASGQWRRTNANQDPNLVFTGQVKCLRVNGSLFEARGEITDVRGGSSPLRGFIIRGSDSGKFSTAPDTYTGGLTLDPQTETSCLAPTSGFPVTEGEITVKDAT
jgi:hypothetical protein